jgi:hypothetical protein
MKFVLLFLISFSSYGMKMNFDFPQVGLVTGAYIDIISYHTSADFSKSITVTVGFYYSKATFLKDPYNYIQKETYDIVPLFPADNMKKAIIAALKNTDKFSTLVED